MPAGNRVPHGHSSEAPECRRGIEGRDAQRGLWILEADGVLLDSSSIVHAAFAATAARHGHRLEDEEWPTLKSLRLSDAYLRLGNPDVSGACRFHVAYVRQRIARIAPCPGVANVLAAAREAGVFIAVTTICAEITEACLVNAGLYSMIDCLVTQEEVRRAAPDPEFIVTSLELSNRRSEEARARAVYVGDAPVGILAAKAAGVTTVGVTYGASNREQLKAARPELVIDSFHRMSCLFDARAGAALTLRVT